MSKAFLKLLAEAIDNGLSGKENLEKALVQYEGKRDAIALPMYEFTCEDASLQPPSPDMENLFSALKENQAQTDHFIGVFAGTVATSDFFSPENIRLVTAQPEPVNPAV